MVEGAQQGPVLVGTLFTGASGCSEPSGSTGLMGLEPPTRWPQNGFPMWEDVLGVAAPEVLDGRFAVGRKEGTEVADVLFQGGGLPLQLLLQLVLRRRAMSRPHLS